MDSAIWAATSPARRRLAVREPVAAVPRAQGAAAPPHGAGHGGAAAYRPGQHGQDQPGEEDRTFDGDGVGAWYQPGGRSREQPQTDPGYREPQGEPARGYRQTLDHRGPGQPRHAGAEGEPDGELPPPKHGASDEERHRVHARYDEHEQGRCDRHPHDRPQFTAQRLFDRPCRGAPQLVADVADIAGDPDCVFPGLGQGRAVPHTPHDLVRAGFLRRDRTSRQPHVDVRRRKRERGGHDGRHVVTTVLHRRRLAEGDRPVSVSRARANVVLITARTSPFASRGTNPCTAGTSEHLEEVFADGCHLHDPDRTRAAHHAFPRVVASHPHRSETAIPLVELVKPYTGFRAVFCMNLGDCDQPVCVRVRQRLPEHVVGDSKLRRCCRR